MRARADPSGFACTATLVAVDTKYQLLSPSLKQEGQKRTRNWDGFLSFFATSSLCNYFFPLLNRLDVTMLKFLMLCTLAVASRAEIAEEEDVLVLKKSNFDEALQAHPNILVEFCE